MGQARPKLTSTLHLAGNHCVAQELPALQCTHTFECAHPGNLRSFCKDLPSALNWHNVALSLSSQRCSWLIPDTLDHWSGAASMQTTHEAGKLPTSQWPRTTCLPHFSLQGLQRSRGKERPTLHSCKIWMSIGQPHGSDPFQYFPGWKGLVRHEQSLQAFAAAKA